MRWLIGLTLVKIFLAWSWGGTADIPQTEAQARAFLAGADVLVPGETSGNPSFFPMGHYLLAAGCLLLAQAFGWPFAFVIKLPAILSDLSVACLLRRIPRAGATAAFLYMVNPLSWLLSVYHGQLHTVAMAGAVLALWLAGQGQPGFSGLALGLAASVRQHFAVLLLPLVRHAQAQRVLLAGSFLLTVMTLNAWLLGSQHPGRILTPTWTYGSWGYTMVLLHGSRLLDRLGWTTLTHAAGTVNDLLLTWGWVVYWAWTAAFAVWVWRQRRPMDSWQAALLFLVGLYAVSPGFGVQWLIWAVPFWLLVDRRGALIYSALAGLFLAGSYWQWTLNTKYHLASITANLHQLAPWDLAGVFGVGAMGFLTWAYCVRTAWRLAWR